VYKGHVPARDPQVVRRLRAARAILDRKTATTEFAYAHPAATVNPHNPRHTPGGSSSGSAAAVADGMVDVALGSQTGGSTIRPSAYCGIVGFKPTHGLIPSQGMKPLAPSLDTVGLLARRVRDIRRLFAVLAGREPVPVGSTPPIRYCPGPFAAHADAASHARLAAARDRLLERNIAVAELELGSDFAALNDAQLLLMAREASANLRREYGEHRGDISSETIALVESGLSATDAEVQQARLLAGHWRERFAAELSGGVLLTFSAPGEAPLLEKGTGNSIFNRVWTLLGAPAITLPFGQGPQGLPLGIQLVAAPGRDDSLLECALNVEAALTPSSTKESAA
jgi:Asp-tRNA(Asn)/Glu-tRNA(Gln) amidotransferase A subunit family amidase